ncbi:hypothetical protein BpHYR1_014144, partial [Brachionus plicatilis]
LALNKLLEKDEFVNRPKKGPPKLAGKLHKKNVFCSDLMEVRLPFFCIFALPLLGLLTNWSFFLNNSFNANKCAQYPNLYFFKI